MAHYCIHTVEVDGFYNVCFAGNYAPFIVGDDAFYATVGETYQYSFSVNDSNGDSFTIETDVETTVTISGTDVTITGIVTNITGFSLTITAKVR